MAFPDHCIRGIPNQTYLTDAETVATHLFYFEDDQFARDDGWTEQSVNWRDDDKAIQLIFNQEKTNGEKQFRGGAAIVPRDELDRLAELPRVNGELSYERRASVDNPYHGNILLRTGFPKAIMKQIAASLALCASVSVSKE